MYFKYFEKMFQILKLFFAVFRYFEEFEKRIPRAEMEKMEVIKIFIFLISLHAFFSYRLPLHCDSLYLPRLLFLESWRKLIKNILEQSVEATGEVFLSSYWSIGFRLQYHLSLFNTVHNFQVLHRVVILIFC